MEALDQFKSQEYMHKLKVHITSESMPSDNGELVTFLYKQVTNMMV